MNQLVAFFAPTTLPNAAGAGVRAPGTAQGDEFAAILAQVQATVSGEQPTTPDASQQLAQLLGQLPPGLVQAAKSLSTDEVAAQIEALQASGTGTQQLDALLATLLQAGQANAPQAAASATPTNAPATSSTLGAVLQVLHAQAETPPAVAPAPGDVANLGLRGSLAPEQAAAEKPAQTGQTTVDVAETLAAQLAIPANLAKPRNENQPQQGQTDKPVAGPQKRGAQAHHAEGALNPAPQDALPTPKPSDASATTSVANQSAQGSAASVAHAQPQATTSGTSNANPTAAAAVPAPALTTLVDAQQMSVTLATAPHQPVPLEALAVHIARKFQAGVSQFEIRLSPAELGQLDISLSVADDGHVTAVVRAERPETLDLLQRDARNLETQLRQAGLDVTSNSLNFSLSNGNGGRQTPFVGWPAFADAQDVQNAAKSDALSTYIAVRRPDGLDIRV
jgi:flagellar hook-length control protein FliK